jgi:hypothetical protein
MPVSTNSRKMLVLIPFFALFLGFDGQGVSAAKWRFTTWKTDPSLKKGSDSLLSTGRLWRPRSGSKSSAAVAPAGGGPDVIPPWRVPLDRTKFQAELAQRERDAEALEASNQIWLMTARPEPQKSKTKVAAADFANEAQMSELLHAGNLPTRTETGEDRRAFLERTKNKKRDLDRIIAASDEEKAIILSSFKEIDLEKLKTNVSPAA